MAKARLFELPETKGTFQLKGIVTGTEKDKFYTETKTKTRKDFRKINFGVTFNEDKTAYVSMQGMPQDNVYFSKQVKKGEKSETLKIAWAERHTFKRDKYRLIGKNIGVKKITDEKGNQVNDKKVLTEFDACKEVGENLKDENNVFIKGKLDYSSFTADNGEKKNSIKLVPNQISLCGNVDFKDEKFEPTHDFTQTIVFMGIDKEKEDEKDTGRFLVSAKIITYKTIETAEFVISNSKLAQVFRKNLKPYTGIEVWGKLETVTQVTEEKDDDVWGESNDMNKINSPTKREFVITGANKASIDTETYSEELIENAMVKINNSNNATKDFADNNNEDWGTASDLSGDSDDDDTPWD